MPDPQHTLDDLVRAVERCTSVRSSARELSDHDQPTAEALTTHHEALTVEMRVIYTDLDSQLAAAISALGDATNAEQILGDQQSPVDGESEHSEPSTPDQLPCRSGAHIKVFHIHQDEELQVLPLSDGVKAYLHLGDWYRTDGLPWSCSTHESGRRRIVRYIPGAAIAEWAPVA